MAMNYGAILRDRYRRYYGDEPEAPVQNAQAPQVQIAFERPRAEREANALNGDLQGIYNNWVAHVRAGGDPHNENIAVEQVEYRGIVRTRHYGPLHHIRIGPHGNRVFYRTENNTLTIYQVGPHDFHDRR